jgi:hypothetical protein
MLRHEHAQLRAVLERALLVVSATASGVLGSGACSGPGSAGEGGDAAATDATTVADTASPSADAASDAEAGVTWPPGCQPSPAIAYDAGADAPNCEYRVPLPCGLPSFVTSIDPIHCSLGLDDCIELCTGPAFPFLSCEVANGFGCDDDAQAFVASDGAPIVIQCDKCTIVGRRPAGLAPASSPRAHDVLGAFFARVAHLEAASVHAFEALAGDLARLGAPAALVCAARRSACEEVRHAQVTARIARRLGAEPAPVRVGRRKERSLRAIATENAVEGCVRETFGALIAAWQARHARDAGIRRAMRRIATEEARHAALAWAVARWMEPRLDPRARRAVRSARRVAVETLRRELEVPVEAELVERAGLPPPVPAARLVDELEAALWQPYGPAVAPTRSRRKRSTGSAAPSGSSMNGQCPQSFISRISRTSKNCRCTPA